MATTGWTIAAWQQAYRVAGDTPERLLGTLLGSLNPQDPAWISLITPAQLASQLAALATRPDAKALPLYGVPFAVKDNIDVAELPTTAACAEFAYRPAQDAQIVARLKAAGAIVLGKTNLDQFATGLVGTRSPYGAVPNSFDTSFISGGSSSGSASVVARGLVPFALGTDTAGSGRVPAGFNNLVGWKPTRGAFSTSGVVPACRSLDCVSLFTLTLADSRLLATLVTSFDGSDSYSRPAPVPLPRQGLGSRPRLAIPSVMEWFGDSEQQAAFAQSCRELQAAGARIAAIDFSPMYALAKLLYEGPWVAERHAALETFMIEHKSVMDPTVASIVSTASRHSATSAYRSEYQRMALQRQIANIFNEFDALLVPTAPLLPTRQQVAQEPVLVNSWLGTYTNFVNLADCSALALPMGFRRDGLPFGITLIAPAWHEMALADWALTWQPQLALPLGATTLPAPAARAQQSNPAVTSWAVPPLAETLPLAVVGAHLSGMPLNHELTSRGARLLERCQSAENYRLYALANSQPPKPALVRDSQGQPIELELWALPKSGWADFLAGVPAPLGLGTVTLADGRQVKGFICEPSALNGALDITEFGGWRAYLASR